MAISSFLFDMCSAKEKRFDISSKDKKMKSNSKKRDDTNANVLGFSDETKWNKWNDLAFHRGGHWGKFLGRS
ncbi:unnamed protein product [Rhizophagus irregularis]|nr:unnamed protein product [Rhizophagus irregularis]